jgi:hypothetical protein
MTRSATTGLNSFAVSSDYMVSVVEGLKPAGVTDMMTGGGSGTITEYGERWDTHGDWIRRGRSLLHDVVCGNTVDTSY